MSKAVNAEVSHTGIVREAGRVSKTESIPVLILFGPTASGKTALLSRLFSGPAPLRSAEVVSADSMQVYRGMDIGTAKPTRAECVALPHHLIDIREPVEQFNAGDFVRLADEACCDIARRGKLPVICGGTGFYLRAFIEGLPPAPPADAIVRETLRKELAVKGSDALREELAAVDAVSAARIHVNDVFRLLRALEVYRSSGRPLSSFVGPTAGESSARPVYRALLVGLSLDRNELYRRINERCAAMFNAGLAVEVRRLYDRGLYPSNAPGLRAIGYREFFIEEPGGHWSFSADHPAVQELVARNSRRYAKRQCTYFSLLPSVHWYNPADEEIRVELRALFTAL